MNYREDLIQKEALLASWRFLFDCLKTNPKSIEARGERDRGAKGLSHAEFASAVAAFDDERPRNIREVLLRSLGSFDI